MKAPHRPSIDQQKQVEAMSGYGVPQADIALLLNIDPKTLRLHYRRELDVGMAKANAKIGQTLFQQAMAGNMAALIFWAKARMNWRETVAHDITTRTLAGSATYADLEAIALAGSDADLLAPEGAD